MESSSSSAPIPQRKTHFQSMDDFLKEQDELDAIRLAAQNASGVHTPSSSPPLKKARRTLNVEALSVEASAIEEIGNTNWIGRLLEYRNANPPADGLKYLDTAIGSAPSRFNCIVTLAESSQRFGEGVSFTRKKDAKQYASKKSVDWLIANNFMPAVGVKFPKPKPIVAQPAPVAKVQDATRPKILSTPVVNIEEIAASPPPATVPKATSFAGQIPELCMRLGFTPPKYEITKVSNDAPLYSGYAHFNGDPRIEGRIGEVEDVFGQKNAKEMIAETLYSFLKDIERQRMAPTVKAVPVEDGDGTAQTVKAQA